MPADRIIDGPDILSACMIVQTNLTSPTDAPTT